LLLPCLNTVYLGKPLTQAQNSLVDILLKFHRVVKGALNGKGILTDLREVCMGAPDFGGMIDKLTAIVAVKLQNGEGVGSTAFIPEEGPDQTESGDDLTGIDPLAFPVGGPLFFRFELYRLPVQVHQDRFDRPGMQEDIFDEATPGLAKQTGIFHTFEKGPAPIGEKNVG
ncbi:MAG: hypothetical protein LBP69_11355, partial [Treponema sp.]|jgi:hypothetical protein|nr:hypothetical protein [Treponema sp.]